MIPVKKPTDRVVLDVLKGFLERTYSRSDVYAWQKEMREHHAEYYPGCMNILSERKSGNFIVQSLTFIKDKGVAGYEETEEYFIRDEDIQEYIAELACVDCKDSNGKIKRTRAHQITLIKDVSYPLVCIDSTDGRIIQRFGVFFLRGIIDDLAEHVEFASIKYEDVTFFLDFRCSAKEYQFTIHGFKGSDEQFANMLLDLNISFEDFSFVNDYALVGKTELWRLDDNGNEFLMSEYSFQKVVFL